MITNDQIEEYLIRIELPFEQVNEGMWLIADEKDSIENIVVLHTPPVITFRVKLLELDGLDDATRLNLYQTLLQLNASDMIAGAYGLEENAVVITDSLQSENLDFNEFQASIDSITMCIREHYENIRLIIPALAQPEPAPAMNERELEADIMTQG